MRSTYPSSTIFVASKRKLHCLYPSGASLQARAIRCASTSPSIFLRDTFWIYSFRRRTASKPSSTSCLRIRSTVCTVMPNASLIFLSGQPGPCSPTSAFNSTCALVNLLAEPLPEDTKHLRFSLSCVDKRTIYFFIDFLQACVCYDYSKYGTNYRESQRLLPNNIILTQH